MVPFTSESFCERNPFSNLLIKTSSKTSCLKLQSVSTAICPVKHIGRAQFYKRSHLCQGRQILSPVVSIHQEAMQQQHAGSRVLLAHDLISHLAEKTPRLTAMAAMEASVKTLPDNRAMSKCGWEFQPPKSK